MAVKLLVMAPLAWLWFLSLGRFWISFWLFSVAVGISLTSVLPQFGFKSWQIGTGLAVTFLLMLAASPALAGDGGGGVFGPLEEATQEVLTAAGADEIADQTTGIFGMLNIIAALVAIGALVYGIFEQRNGNTMRESFMPFLMVLLLYIGAQFVMSIFLSA
ncbi:MAG: hypothetical protein GVY04_00140 [Cyanobacteria bacterium]|nr:hypothetical protein [Cyanobacteria bacterium GSL.Bin1]